MQVREKIKKALDNGIMINLSKKSIEKMDNSECKNCYHAPECLLRQKELKKCDKWFDKTTI